MIGEADLLAENKRGHRPNVKTPLFAFVVPQIPLIVNNEKRTTTTKQPTETGKHTTQVCGRKRNRHNKNRSRIHNKTHIPTKTER